MIGMNDDTRFLTENRHGQLLAEAETRRLANDGGTRGGSLGAAIHRLGSRLFGTDERTAKAAVVEAAVAAPRLSVAARQDRTGSVAGDCSGTHAHRQIAA